MNWIKTWWTALLFGTAVSLSSYFTYDRLEKLEHEWTTAFSKELAAHMAGEWRDKILSHASTLQLLASTDFLKAKKTYEETAQALIQFRPEVYALNWVNAQGQIQAVFPEPQNREALNQNLLKREDVREYLIQARDDRKPKMSHQLMTYQQVEAFTLYVPLYSGDRFLGWVNAVIDFGKWLDQYFVLNNAENVHVVIKWNHPESRSIDRGRLSAPIVESFQFQILNQGVQIQIGFEEPLSHRARHLQVQLVHLWGLSLTLLAMILILLLIRAQSKVKQVNSHLLTKNQLLTSLSHDIATPLASLSGIIALSLRAPNHQIPEKYLSTIPKLMARIEAMLLHVRRIHARGEQLQPIEIKPTHLWQAVQTCLEMVQVQLDAKGIQIDLSGLSREHWIEADLETLSNHVLLNLIQNSIHYSPPQSVLKITSHQDGSHIVIQVLDQGPGLDQASRDPSRPHAGTGLGLPQVECLTASMHGSFEIRNHPTGGALAELRFRQSSPQT